MRFVARASLCGLTWQQKEQSRSKVLDQFVFDVLQLSSDTVLRNILATLEIQQGSDV